MPRQSCKGRNFWLVVVVAVVAITLGSVAHAAGIWGSPATVMKAVALSAIGADIHIPADGKPDPDDDPQDLQGDDNNPCGVSSSVGSDATGPGMHITIATGNVWTKVPILKCYGGGETTFDLTLTYNSTKPGTDALGQGWTHGYDVRWYPVPQFPDPGQEYCSFQPSKLVVVDGDGRRNAFWFPDPPDGQGYLLTPPGRNTGLRFDHCAGLADCQYCATSCPAPLEQNCCTWSEPELMCLNHCYYGIYCDAQGWEECSYYPDCGLCCAPCSPVAECVEECLSVDGQKCCQAAIRANGLCTSPIYTQEFPDGSSREFGANRRISKITTARGLTTTFTYDSNDPATAKLLTITDGYGQAVEFGYDGNGRLTSITGPDNGLTTLTYDGDRLTAITDPLGQTDPTGHVQSFEYDASGRMTKETLKNGRSYTCKYDVDEDNNPAPGTRIIEDSLHGIVVKWHESGYDRIITDGQHKEWKYTTNDWLQLIAVQSPSGGGEPAYYAKAKYGLDENHPSQYNRLIETRSWSTDPVVDQGPVRLYSWGDYGALVSVTDEEGYSTGYSYDSTFPALPTARIDPSGGVWEYIYNDHGDVTLVTDPLRNQTQYGYTYFSEGRIHEITKTDRNGYNTTWTYATDGKLVSKTVALGPGQGVVTTTYEHDSYGRRTMETVGGHSTKYEYDAMGRLTKVIEDFGEGKLNLTTEYTYDGHGLLETVTDPQGNVTKYEYDLRNRLWKVKENWSPAGGPGVAVTEYEYDGNGNVTKMTNAEGHSTYYGYNARNQLIWSEDAEGYETFFTRDGVGNLLRRERCRAPGAIAGENEFSCPGGGSDAVAYIYDGLGRVLTKQIDPTTLRLTTTYTYPAASCSCGGAGGSQPTTVTDPSGRMTGRKFDLLGRTTRVVRKVNGGQPFEPDHPEWGDDNDAITWYFYDPEGNLRKVVGPEGETTIYLYDGAGRMVREWKLAQPPDPGEDDPQEPAPGDLVTNFAWDEAGNLTQVTLPNGHTLTADYDGAARLRHVYDGATSNDPVLAEYTYDPAGNVLSRTDGLERTWSYAYDWQGRVTREFTPLYPWPTDKFTSHEYDKVGNLILTTNANGVRTMREYDKLNRLVKVLEDNPLEMEEPPGGPVPLDGEAQSGTQEQEVLVPGGQGGRDGGGEPLGPPMELAPVSTPTQNTKTEYVYDGSRLVALKDHDGNTTTYAYNGAGQVHTITYPDEGVVEMTYEYTYQSSPPGWSRIHRKDQLSRTTTFEFNELGRLRYRSSSNRRDDFSFDRAGRLTGARHNVGNPSVDAADWTRTYDKLGRPSVETQTFLEADGFTYTPYSTAFAYSMDAEAHTTTWTMTTPGGRQVVHTLDKLNRLIAASAGSGIGVTWTHDAAGQRESATLASGVSSAFGYDLNGRMTSLSHAGPGGGGPVELLFDAEYGYDAVGNRTFTRLLPRVERSERYGYDNLNRLTIMERGEFNEDGTAVVTPISHPTLASNEQWADLDHRGNWLDYRWARTVDGESSNYRQTRDVTPTNEYWAVRLPDLDPALVALMQYDDAGNLTSDPLAVNAGDPCGPGVPACGSGQPCGVGILSGVDPGSAGLSACPTGQEYVYDVEHRLTEVKRHTDGATLAQYEYDALGRRIHTIEYVDAATGAALDPPRKTRHVYVGIETIQEYLCSTGASGGPCGAGVPAGKFCLAREFLWGDPARFPEPVAMIDWTDAGQAPGTCGPGVPPVGCVYHFLHDVLGSVVGLTDEAGALVERYTYDPYGRTYIEHWDASANEGTGGWIAAEASAFGNPFAWTGQRYDPGTGLYAFLYRSYSPALGRWLQRDPIGYVEGANLYEYVLGRPLDFADPLGLDGEGASGGNPKANCDDLPPWDAPGRPPWDPVNNKCHKACASGRNNAVYNDGMSFAEGSDCINSCRAHCDRKAAEGITPSEEHGNEFWTYDSNCGSKPPRQADNDKEAQKKRQKKVDDEARKILRHDPRHGQKWPEYVVGATKEGRLITVLDCSDVFYEGCRELCLQRNAHEADACKQGYGGFAYPDEWVLKCEEDLYQCLNP